MKALAKSIRPLRTRRDYKKALDILNIYLDSKPGTREGDLVQVLALIIEKYEEEHFNIEGPAPAEAIKFRMEQMGWEQSDLARLLGSRSRASEILTGSRSPSLRMIRLIHTEMGIPAESLIGTSG
jgi:HTH-type transcriptional regulator/antitoxin HigA